MPRTGTEAHIQAFSVSSRSCLWHQGTCVQIWARCVLTADKERHGLLAPDRLPPEGCGRGAQRTRLRTRASESTSLENPRTVGVRFDIPDTAIVSDTLNIPQDDVGIYSRLDLRA